MRYVFLLLVLSLVCSFAVLAEEERPSSLVLPDGTSGDTGRRAPPSILGTGKAFEGGTGRSLPSLEQPEGRPESSPSMPPREGLLPPGFGGEQQGILVPPPSPASGVRWKSFDLGEAFGYNPLITGVVEYPEGWLSTVDTFNKAVTFAEDATGRTALSAYLAIQNPAIRTAEDLAQQVIALLYQNVTGLTIESQDFQSDPQAAQHGLSVTYGRVVLGGNYQGNDLTMLLQPYVMYVPLAKYSLSGAILCYAPREVFQEKLQKYFNHMIATFEALARAPIAGASTPK